MNELLSKTWHSLAWNPLFWLLVIFAAYALIGGTVSAPPPFKAEKSTATGG
ncbi:hypothetical protein [Nitrosospira sp. Nsp11]|uniref:hypothetical protein n=1 Tax=Nitrosospira sp. Nsp11 TaxID=1855338 RepID=UPI0015B48BC1|nr:hypothetical protein [Nitrosospira sp. Nsp11]